MNEIESAAPPLVCPVCRAALSALPSALVCVRCSRRFPVDDDIADFAEGRYFDDHPDPGALSQDVLRGMENENEGRRIEDYYLPILRASGARRVLDSGCGNGEAVDVLLGAGFDAWGHDLSAFRKWQWKARARRDRLVVADGLSLPFPDGFFDAVISSGVLEHVGVSEHGGPGIYEVSPLPDLDERRMAFLAGLARVLAPGGTLFLDFPNGAFPIDFWHGTRAGAARWHSPFEGFLPTVKSIRRLAARLDPSLRVSVRSPRQRLRFHQVGAHWYGRLFRAPMAAFYALTAVPGFTWLAGTPLNPYLTLSLRRPSRRPASVD
jgi:SAM-dependent methyltransferase